MSTGAAGIRAAHVAVVGIGGVGSWAAEALARSGVGELTLVDLDHVAESNINRQVHALEGTLGQAKVQAMQERIAQINPGCIVHGVEEFVEPENWPALLPAGVTRHHRRMRPGQGQGRDGRVGAEDAHACSFRWAPPAASAWRTRWTSTIWPTPRMTRCWPNCAIACASSMARRARAGRSAWPVSSAAKPWRLRMPSCAIEGDGSLNCHGYGSVVSVTATFGQCAAGWVLDRSPLRKRL